MPAISLLPTRWAYAAARQRGRWAARHAADWVELSLGLAYIRARTEAAWSAARPDATPDQRAAWAEGRYATWVEEELEACWIARGDWHRFARLNVEPARQPLGPEAGRGLVLIQAHFNNPTLACAAAGMAAGRPVWMTVSGVYENDRVHPRLQALFRAKYRGVERHLNGGRLLHSESATSMRQLYRALERGEIVIVVADLPPEPGSDGLCVPWLGGYRRLAAGAYRLASRTGSAIGALWLDAPAPGQWALQAAVQHPQTNVDAAACQAYDRLSQQLQHQPGRWWAAHLLQDSAPCSPSGGRPTAPAA